MFAKRAAAFLLTASILAVPASAHGHSGQKGHRTWTQSDTCTVCSVEDCTRTGRHTHRGVTYCGYDHEDGVCDGTCYAVCAVEDCALTGRHVHDGVTYCGYDHEHGFCDGTCLEAVQTTAAPVTGSCHGGHHGGRHH